jgi:hypothetical protein
MSNPTASADGGAMPPRERETHAQSFARLRVLRVSIERTLDQMGDILDAADAPPEATPERRALLDVDEALDQTQNLIIAASNLAASSDPYLGGLCAVIVAAEEKLDAARRSMKQREAANV